MAGYHSAVVPLPDSYGELRRWFPTLVARSRALGRSRETLRTWERSGTPVPVRPSSARMIDIVASVAGDVERLVGDPVRSGDWMLTAQPALRGRTPAELARLGTAEALRELRGTIMPERATVVGGSVSAAEIELARHRTRSLGLPLDRGRERPRTADKARVLRRVGTREALIGPVVE